MKKIYLFYLLAILLLTISILASEERDAIGDVNNDGVVNVQDIVMVVGIILEHNEDPTEYELWAADVSGDDYIDVTDIIIIVNYILVNGILCGDGYAFCPGSISECCPLISDHEFIWEIDTLGIYGTQLRDVFIVDENEIWAVGNIETENNEYNAAHWNGSEWEFLGIFNNTIDLYSVIVFSDDDIWMTDWASPIHWDGNEWTLYNLYQLGLEGAGWASWGTSSSNMYFVGYEGSIVHYDGELFEQMESGTPVNLVDISGNTTGDHIFVVGYRNVDWWGECGA
ncbi:MAG: hypothetical protein H8E14_01540 [Candidatus Marinimicrobia bacterium]|nr:hypothetical protein [Candidatus Neomarinimicrobiota bacterium]